jgi:hypothetical protein
MCHPNRKVPLPSTRLKKTGFLKAGEENNINAVAAAKAKYQQKYGFPV